MQSPHHLRVILPLMPEKRSPARQPDPARSLDDLLVASSKLAARAAKAAREMNEIAAEMEATRKLIEKRMKEQRRSIN